MRFTIHVDTRYLEKTLGGLRTELPFATSRGINDTLLAVQEAEVKQVHSRFTVRRPQFVKRSVKITTFSRKTDLTGTIALAQVGPKDNSDILAKFESGGRKKARGNYVAIPSAHIQPDRSRLVSARKKPRNLPRSFKVEAGSKAFIFQHFGKGKNERIILAYVLKPSVTIPKRLGFVATARSVIDRHLYPNIEKRLAEGIAKAQSKTP